MTLLRLNGSCAAWELVKRGPEILPLILKYVKDNAFSEKEEWFYFFEKFTRHHGILSNNSIPPKDFNEWEKLLFKNLKL